jgi:hypothetical protein
VIGSDIAAALPGLQAESESLMQDQIRVEVLADTPTFNPADASSSRAVLATPYEGKARIRAAKEPATVLTADDQVTVQRYECSAPLTATGLRVGQVVTVVSSVDPALTGKTLIITAVQGGTLVTSRRFIAADQQ